MADNTALAANLAKLQGYLAPLKAGIKHFIGGEAASSASGAVFDTQSPIDGSQIASVALGSAADIDRAAKAARDAFPAWRAISGAKRRCQLP